MSTAPARLVDNVERLAGRCVLGQESGGRVTPSALSMWARRAVRKESSAPRATAASVRAVSSVVICSKREPTSLHIFRAVFGDRTRDLSLTMAALYQLS